MSASALAKLAGPALALGALAWARIVGLPLWLVVVVVLGGAAAWLVVLPVVAARLRRSRIETAAEAGRAAAADAALREALAGYQHPAVYVDPARPATDAVFEWVNGAATREWRRPYGVLTSVPYNQFVHAEDAAALSAYVRALDAGLTHGRGHVNHYSDPATGEPLEPQEWERLGDSGFWIARPLTREADALRRAAEAEADLAAVRPAIEERLRQ